MPPNVAVLKLKGNNQVLSYIRSHKNNDPFLSC